MNIGGLEISILIPALLAGLLVLSTHVPLGQQVLSRGIVFIDLAIAQVAGLGVTFAAASGFDPHGWRMQASAIGAALLGALLLTATEKKWPQVQEALIGVLFVLAACIELLVLANNPRGGEHLKDLLVGQILWVDPKTLIPIAIGYAAALLVWFSLGKRLGHLGFYALFALVVTQSVQLVGIYLVFSSLIIPALAARRFAPSARLFVGYSVGIAGYLSGLIASALTDAPTGPMIVVALVSVFALTLFIPESREAKA
ncbi:MAG: metal ABC transporter permease [Parvularculaceae bacterium]